MRIMSRGEVCSQGNAGMLCVSARLLSLIVCTCAPCVITTSLLLTHYLPRRFRIHPLPYLSDAGLRDPERIILSLGLSVCGYMFLPFVLCVYLSQVLAIREAACKPVLVLRKRVYNCGRIARMGVYAGILTSAALVIFTSIPGWFFLHHVYAAVFAIAGTVWCTCHTMFTHGCVQSALRTNGYEMQLGVRLNTMYALCVLQALIIGTFAIVWISVIIQWPFRMIPNKDLRFVVLALLEYVGTSAFLTFVAMTGREVSKFDLQLQIGLKEAYAQTSAARRLLSAAAV